MTTKALATHSPGPWRTGDLYHTVFGPPNGNPSPKVIATLGPGQVKANARLIAAAPELLALAIELLDDHQVTEPHHHHHCDLCQRAGATIRKAKGEL